MYTYTAFFEHSFPSKSWQRLDDHRRSFLPGCPPEPQEPAMLAPRRRGGVITISHDGSMVLLYMVTWIPSIYPSHVSIYTSTMDPSWVWIHDGYVYDILWYGVYSYYSYYINTYINWLYIYIWVTLTIRLYFWVCENIGDAGDHAQIPVFFLGINKKLCHSVFRSISLLFISVSSHMSYLMFLISHQLFII